MVSGMKKEFLSLFEINEFSVLLLAPIVFNIGHHWHIPVVFVVSIFMLS